MKCMITGFEPFGNETINPSWEAVQALPDEIEGIEVIKCCLPTTFYRSKEVLYAKLKEVQPDLVICVGQAGGRDTISIEKVAINYMDARIADNSGNQPVDVCICEEGPDAYFTTLPLRKMVSHLRACEIPATISYSAGTFVCNYIMYAALDYMHHSSCPVPAGFIHVPFAPSQGLERNVPTMSLPLIQEGLREAIRAIALDVCEVSTASMGQIQ